MQIFQVVFFSISELTVQSKNRHEDEMLLSERSIYTINIGPYTTITGLCT